MEGLEQKTVELLDKLDKLATQYTPDVVESAVSAVQISAISNLIYGVVGLFCVVICWWLATNATRFCRKKKQDGGWGSDWEIGVALSFYVGGLVCSIMTVISIWDLFNLWNWIAILNPKLALAHRILGL